MPYAYLCITHSTCVCCHGNDLFAFWSISLQTFFIPFTGIINAVISMTISRDTPAPKVTTLQKSIDCTLLFYEHSD